MKTRRRPPEDLFWQAFPDYSPPKRSLRMTVERAGTAFQQLEAAVAAHGVLTEEEQHLLRKTLGRRGLQVQRVLDFTSGLTHHLTLRKIAIERRRQNLRWVGPYDLSAWVKGLEDVPLRHVLEPIAALHDAMLEMGSYELSQRWREAFFRCAPSDRRSAMAQWLQGVLGGFPEVKVTRSIDGSILGITWPMR